MYGHGFRMPEPQHYGGYGSPTVVNSTGNSVNSSSIAQEMENDMQKLITHLQSILQASPLDELQIICDDDAKLSTLIEDSDQMKQLKQKRSQLMQQNKDQAVLNLSYEPDFELKKAQLGELMVLQNRSKEKLQKSKQELGNLSGHLSPDTTVALLQAATAEKESTSEDIAQKFLDKDLSLDDFISSFKAERTIYHLRKIKCDKMAEEVRNRQYQQGSSSRYSSTYGRY